MEFLNISEAQKLLRQHSLFNNSSTRDGEIETKKRSDSDLCTYDRLRQALQLVAQNSEYQIFGVCAQSAEEGLTALREYSHALGYEPPGDLESIAGAVYIKFNPTIGLQYMSAYEGRERGVLVSCQSPNSDGTNEIYGHLPIDLFSNFTQDKK